VKKQKAFLFISVALGIAVILNFWVAGASGNMAISSQDKGVVQKCQGESFTVSITFQNTGGSGGSWAVNVVFEGDAWNWKGTDKTLSLTANEKKTLVWTGAVPSNAPVNSIARLVVYYDGSSQALDWWIQIALDAVLTIQSSSVT
jgi:hypothetical protein